MRCLTTPERIELEACLRSSKDLSEWKRLFVILSYDEGQSIEELSKQTRLSIWTVELYLKDYSSRNKTKNDPRGGSEPKLTDEQSSELERHLTTITYLKVKQIIAYVEKTFQISYSRSGMNTWLKERGFTYKRPQKVPGKADPTRQEEFAENYKKLKDSLPADEEIYFIDAMHPDYQTQAMFGWIKKGDCKTLQTTGKQNRLHFMGAVKLDGMKIVVNEYATIDADAMINFLKNIEAQSQAAVIHIIADNARSNKNNKLTEYLKQSRIRLHYLPPYSPNLNPIERLWKILREMILYNRYYETCAECFQAIRGFFTEKIPQITDILCKRITDNFQTIKLNPIIMP
jgi:transposase